jgi:predicted nucleic acid-binding Zn ribbon protein
MKQQYADWIKANVTDNGYGQCKEITKAMAAAFPGLSRVRGHYHCPVWGERAHWWLIEPDGWQVVDPTAAQFPSKGTGEYVAWEEGAEEPTGMCPNCGEYCYDGNYVCSDECGQAYVAFCTLGI